MGHLLRGYEDLEKDLGIQVSVNNKIVFGENGTGFMVRKTIRHLLHIWLTTYTPSRMGYRFLIHGSPFSASLNEALSSNSLQLPSAAIDQLRSLYELLNLSTPLDPAEVLRLNVVSLLLEIRCERLDRQLEDNYLAPSRKDPLRRVILKDVLMPSGLIDQLERIREKQLQAIGA